MLNIAAVPVVCGNTPCAYIVLAGGCKAVDKYMINKASPSPVDKEAAAVRLSHRTWAAAALPHRRAKENRLSRHCRRKNVLCLLHLRRSRCPYRYGNQARIGSKTNRPPTAGQVRRVQYLRKTSSLRHTSSAPWRAAFPALPYLTTDRRHGYKATLARVYPNSQA